MNFPDEDSVDDLFNNISYVDTFGLDDPHSPLGHDHSLQLQVPMREPSPVSPSRDLDMFGFGDSSLSIPMREYGVSEHTRLSPLPSYQNNGQGYSNSGMQLDVPYNSFEQPVAVVKDYHNISQPAVQPMDQRSYYAKEQPSTSRPQQQPQQQAVHSSSGGGAVMQMLNTPPSGGRGMQNAQMQQQQPNRNAYQQQQQAPQQVQHKAPTQTRQRPIQPKTQNGRRKVGGGSNSVGEVLSNANKASAGAGGPSASSVRLSPQQMQQLAFIGNEIAQMEQQQSQLGIDNRHRIEELKQQQAQIFIDALSAQPQQVEVQVINQLNQIKQHPAPTQSTRTPQSRSNANSNRSSHSVQRGFDTAPDSPQYQPQMYLASQPSTSQAPPIYSDYQQPSPIVVSQHMHSSSTPQQLQPVQPQQQRNMYRVATVSHTSLSQANVQVTTTYHSPQTNSQQPMYIQNRPQQQQQQGQQGQHQQINTPPTSLSHMNINNAGPTVAEAIRTGQLRSLAEKPMMNAPTRYLYQQSPQQQQQQYQQQVHVIPTTSMQAPPLMAPPPKVAIFQQPARPTAAHVAKRIEEKRESRLLRLRELLSRQQQSVTHPETERPFADTRDVLIRLLPYHQFAEPNIRDEELEQFDSNYLRKTINLQEGKRVLENRLRNILFTEAQKSREEEEKNLLLFLDGEYERRKLEEEKEKTNPENIESFVSSSSIITALRNGHVFNSRRPSPPTSQPKVPLHYEYYPFPEEPRVVSPYKSPSPVKSPELLRSPSPLKSPLSVGSPRLRNRSSAGSVPSPSSIDSNRNRTQSKTKDTPEKRPVHDRLRRLSSRQSEDEESKTTATAPKTALHPPSLKAPPRLPAKKELLSRARKAMPLALRSPPAQATRPVPAAPGSTESDEGSCSPELGLEDVAPQPTTAAVEPPAAPAKPAQPSPAKVQRNGPLKPPPLPRNAMKREALVKAESDGAPEKYRFKPQVPRPSKAVIDEKPEKVEVNTKPVTVNESTDKSTAVNCVKAEVDSDPVPKVLPPIKLKLKLGGLSMTELRDRSTPENLERNGKKKKKKKRKERERKSLENRHSEMNGTHSKEDMLLVPTEGPRIKIRFNFSRTSTPSIIDSKPSTPKPSDQNVVAEEDEPKQKVPRLKIRFGGPAAASPDVVAPVTKKENGSDGVRSATLPATKAELPSVDFSDDSDSDAERLRSSTDQALRNCGMMDLCMKAPPTNTPVLPWSSASQK